jgi:hypothetical protein
MLWIAPGEKDTGTETLEDRLWKAADQLRADSGLTSAPVFTTGLRWRGTRVISEPLGSIDFVHEPTATHRNGRRTRLRGWLGNPVEVQNPLFRTNPRFPHSVLDDSRAFC